MLPPLLRHGFVIDVNGTHGEEPHEVLVVDDLPEMCDYLRTVLARIRHPAIHITTESDSQRALELVRTKTFDLVISDARMPRVSGIEVLEAAQRHNPDGRRVLITAYEEIPSTPDEFRRAELDAFVKKPVKSEDVVRLVVDILKENPAALAECRIRVREIERSMVPSEGPPEPPASQA